VLVRGDAVELRQRRIHAQEPAARVDERDAPGGRAEPPLERTGGPEVGPGELLAALNHDGHPDRCALRESTPGADNRLQSAHGHPARSGLRYAS
jgi:hypothetical protein